MSDNVTDITVPILIEIRDQLRGLNGKVEHLSNKVDSLVEAAGAGRRDHETRLSRVEARMDTFERRDPR